MVEVGGIGLTIKATDTRPTVPTIPRTAPTLYALLMRGLGGGNPEVTLSFEDARGEGRSNPLRFLTYQCGPTGVASHWVHYLLDASARLMPDHS